MNLTISVITPSFNQGQFIDRTIQSVLNQDLTASDEYIICDGGSTDETVEILQGYSDRLRWLSEPDQGQADAVNKGMALTTGNIIAWINSDDIYYPGTLNTIRTIFTEHPEIDAIYGDADHIDEQDHSFEAYPTEPWNLQRLQEICYLCQPAVFFRRTLVSNLGPLKTALNYCMDYELWLRYGQTAAFYYISQKLAGSRLYATNKTLSQRAKVHSEINTMLVQKFGQISERWLFEYAHVRTEEMIGYYYKSLWNPFTEAFQIVPWTGHLATNTSLFTEGLLTECAIDRADKADKITSPIPKFTACINLDQVGFLQKQHFINSLVKHSLWAFWYWQPSALFKVLPQIWHLWFLTNYLCFKRLSKQMLKRIFLTLSPLSRHKYQP